MTKKNEKKGNVTFTIVKTVARLEIWGYQFCIDKVIKRTNSVEEAAKFHNPK